MATTEPDLVLKGVHCAGSPQNTRWDLCCKGGLITSTIEHKPVEGEEETSPRLVTQSFCHPHIHLDKCFLLSHPKYEDLEIEKGDFAEAMKLTSEAKSRFEHDDLMERGRALIKESINFGVTHMRAFVEVDLVVKHKCLEAGLALKEEFKDQCYIQICVFAQDPIFSYPDHGRSMQRLLDSAASRPGVEAFGSTPYVEKDEKFERQIRNIEYSIKLAMRYELHIDFHIDYNLDEEKPCMAIEALKLLNSNHWPSNYSMPNYRTIVFGHCTRLSLFTADEWHNLCELARTLPVAIVGLPTSDLFMMGRPGEDEEGGERLRATLQIPHIIKKYKVNVVLGVNNVGNAFTPQGSCDPLSLASFGIGLYHAGTKADTELLLSCISSRAKLAIGIDPQTSYGIEVDIGVPADLVIFGSNPHPGTSRFRARKTTQELVYEPIQDRTTVFGGKIVST